MKRSVWLATAAMVVCTVAAFSGGRLLGPRFVFESEKTNPVTNLRFPKDDEFSFAIVSDRTGGHRANIFAQAVERLNLMQPEFVMSVGDLIEGGKIDEKGLVAQWAEFDRYVGKLQMPFFYVGGNHDLGSAAATKFWQEKLGRRHYHFVYRNVLFLMLNSEDPPGAASGAIGKAQQEWIRQTLAENASVRWTLVFLHRPMWTTDNGAKNGFAEVEKSLAGRNYTVFAGHLHRFKKYVRQGMNYYQLATTGGSSLVRGVEYGEFDHITWLTMKSDGPTIGHLRLDAILPENLQTIVTDEPGKARKTLPTQIVRGWAHYDGSPAFGATVTFLPTKDGAKASGLVEADGSFRLSTYAGFDGAVAGEYQVTVAGAGVAKKYGKPGDLRATVTTGENRIELRLAP